MDFKGKKFGLYGTIVALVIIVLAPLLPLPFGWAGEFIGVALLVAAVLVIWRYWRCPHCNALMPVRGLYEPEYCPICGKRLQPYE